jgi:hypothetical protein
MIKRNKCEWELIAWPWSIMTDRINDQYDDFFLFDNKITFSGGMNDGFDVMPNENTTNKLAHRTGYFFPLAMQRFNKGYLIRRGNWRDLSGGII